MNTRNRTQVKALITVVVFSAIVSVLSGQMAGIYVATAIVAGNCLLCLIRLKRWREWHHLYLGLLLFACAMFALPYSSVQQRACLYVIWLIILDDTYQHNYQVECLDEGVAVPADFSPLHKLWVSFYRKVFT